MCDDHSSHQWVPSVVRRLTVLVALLTLIVPGTALTAGAADDPSFAFSGGGFGHSVGLSQFGAYGMSRAGYSWQEIMTHYFTGASPGQVGPVLAATPIWVNLMTEQSAVTLT
ncbi:MAG: hypothetical protein V1757_02020, partial [Actinomycetota bacterium]